ncbi:MAG: hypothetical protein LBU05_05855, partial [Bifidobacteriaceae bacterium]|nr:hypothetical protein [Bifidobacteriaceae bacterium]
MNLSNTAAERRREDKGGHSPAVRVIFYAVGVAMILIEVALLLDMQFVADFLGSRFAGQQPSQRSWASVFNDPLARLWCVSSAVLTVGALSALWAVRRSKAHDIRRVQTTELNATGWRAIYQQRLVITDLVVVLWSMLGAQVLWLGPGRSDLGLLGDQVVPYGIVGLVAATGWIVTLQLVGA